MIDIHVWTVTGLPSLWWCLLQDAQIMRRCLATNTMDKHHWNVPLQLPSNRPFGPNPWGGWVLLLFVCLTGTFDKQPWTWPNGQKRRSKKHHFQGFAFLSAHAWIVHLANLMWTYYQPSNWEAILWMAVSGCARLQRWSTRMARSSAS